MVKIPIEQLCLVLDGGLLQLLGGIVGSVLLLGELGFGGGGTVGLGGLLLQVSGAVDLDDLGLLLLKALDLLLGLGNVL